jgi:hypothetical protein
MHDDQTVGAVLGPARVWSRAGVLTTDAVPRRSGVYAWWFRAIPPTVPVDGCIIQEGLTLLYVGIAPKAPAKMSMKPSRQTLRRRLRDHMRGNAAGSTLRLTLGCLLADSLRLELRRVGSSNRLTFADGAERLSGWLDKNAAVSWCVCDSPWEVESRIILSFCLPLNLAQNRSHAFHARLTERRVTAKRKARELTNKSGER